MPYVCSSAQVVLDTYALFTQIDVRILDTGRVHTRLTTFGKLKLSAMETPRCGRVCTERLIPEVVAEQMELKHSYLRMGSRKAGLVWGALEGRWNLNKFV